jgi:FKBP-type peptidyl-prolyl cis-trans isomerase (trigger factor)
MACDAGPSLDDLLQVLHDQLRQEHRARWRDLIREQVVGSIVDRSKLALPENWVNQQFKAAWLATDAEALKQLGIKLPPRTDQISWQSWQKQPWFKEQQARALKTRLVLREIGTKAGLELDAEELLRPLKVMSSVSRRPDAWTEALARLKADGVDESYANQVWLDKIVRWLMSQAKLTSQGLPLVMS